MKELSIMFAIAVLLCVGCGEKYDDSVLNNRVDNLENRVAKLEELCKQMNTNISSLQTIITALQNNDYVTGVTPVTDNGGIIGYTITFTKSSAITIYHGQNGKDGINGADGQDGHTPIIGARQDTDGVYYWTLDGNWLLDNSGNKIKAEGRDGKDGTNGQSGKDGIDGSDGKDGITPQMKIEYGYWYVSTNNGATWVNLGKATGENGKYGVDGKDGASDGDSMFHSVTQDDHNAYFTLADGTIITIPLASDNLFGRLRSVKYIPRYSDGKATLYDCISESYVKMDFEVQPKDAVVEITKSWQRFLSLKAVYTATRSSRSFVEMPIVSCDADTTNGIISIKASGENLDLRVLQGYQTASAYLSISDGNANVTSEYIPLTVKKDKYRADIYYMTASGNTIEIDDTDLDIWWGANIVSHTNAVWDWDGGYKISFDDSATIPANAFSGNNDLTRVLLSGDITSVGVDAFSNCENLVSAEIYSDITSIKPATFCNCVNLENFNMPDKVTSIESAAFAGCYKLSSIDTKNVTSIGQSAFNSCKSLKEINIPNVTHIEGSAFRSCESLVKVDMPKVTHLSGFSNCKSLIEVNIPNVTHVGANSFADCIGLTEIDMPKVTYIGESAFRGCENLIKVDMPNVVNIGNDAFNGCAELIEINLPDKANLKEMYIFKDCKKLRTVNIPDCNTRLVRTFEGCESLEHIDIPESVTIMAYTFQRCSNLRDIVIPAGVTEMWNVFDDCDNLSSIYLRPTTPPVSGAGYNCLGNTKAKIYVPKESVEAYKNSEYWSIHADRIEGYDF